MADESHTEDRLEEVNAILRGGRVGGANLFKAGKDLYGLGGKTIVFTAPAGTVTFVTDNNLSQESLALKDIIDQINAVHAGLARAINGRLHLEQVGAAAAVAWSSGTALPQLGLGPNAAFAGDLYSTAGGAAPSLEQMFTSPISGATYILVINE